MELYVWVHWFTLEGILVLHKSIQDRPVQLLKGIVGRGEQGEVSRLTQLVDQTRGSSHSLDEKQNRLDDTANQIEQNVTSVDLHSKCSAHLLLQ